MPLPSDASQQREQLVRRLAAEDSDIDLISMDVIWTAEFAEAKWVVPWPKDVAAKVSDGVIPAVLATGRYKHRMYGAPLNTGTQLLWYRKDLVPTPPTTWAEMIDEAQTLPAGERAIEVQAARYEGLTVWFNSLLASAGGRIVTPSGKVSLKQLTRREQALQVMRDVARAKGSDPSISNNFEDDGRLAFQAGNAAFMVNYPFVDPAIKEGNPDVYENMGAALWPRVDPNEPAHVSLGGFNLGVGAFSNHKAADFAAAQCLEQPAQQVIYAKGDGLAPITQSLYQDARIRKAFPYADLLLQTLQQGSTRPVSPAYNDISLAVQDTLHPPGSINPTWRRLDAARAASTTPSTREGCCDEARRTPGPPTRPSRRRSPTRPARPRRRNRRTRSERRLGWMLCAPAAIVMIAVTAYPIGYAIYLSLQRADLRFPNAEQVRRPRQLLVRPVGRTCGGRTSGRPSRSRSSRSSIELVLGMALAFVMHRALVGRGLVRSAILIPYGIVTVDRRPGVEVRVHAGHRLHRLLVRNRQGLAHPARAARCSSSSSPRSGRPRRSWRCCCWPGSRSCPSSLIEAAKVDGATSWQAFRRVTLPLMKGAILVAVLFRTLDAFRVFDSIFIQTQGANNTESVSILGYNQLLNRLNLGIGSAVSVADLPVRRDHRRVVRQGLRGEPRPATR